MGSEVMEAALVARAVKLALTRRTTFQSPRMSNPAAALCLLELSSARAR